MSRVSEALDVGIVSPHPAALGFEAAPGLRLAGVGGNRRLRWGKGLLRILEPKEAPHGSASGGGPSGGPGTRCIAQVRDPDGDLFELAQGR